MTQYDIMTLLNASLHEKIPRYVAAKYFPPLLDLALVSIAKATPKNYKISLEYYYFHSFLCITIIIPAYLLYNEKLLFHYSYV